MNASNAYRSLFSEFLSTGWMQRCRWGLAVATGAILVSGCGALAPGFTERDQFVVNTPRYYDNRVYYVAPTQTDRKWLLQDAVTARTNANDEARIRHGSALSIILNSVSMPPAANAKDGVKPQGGRDIAVVLDVGTKVTGASEPIVAWYQRGVHPDQALNFSNLLLYFDPRWDARVAPMIRIRVVDVTSEKNAEVREALGQVKQFSSVLGAFLPATGTAAVSVASRAAELILTRPNEQLLDYTVQFYSEEQLAESFGSDLTPLKRGRVLLIGRPLAKASDYWRGFAGNYDGDTLTVFNKEQAVTSPVVVLTVSTAQAIVPTIVSARSAYLQKLLSEAQQADAAAVKTAGRAVWDGVRTFTLLEDLRRSRDQAAVAAVYDAYKENVDNAVLGSEDKALLRQTLRNISTCTTLDTETRLTQWWTSNKSTIRFQKDAFKLENEKCPT